MSRGLLLVLWVLRRTVRMVLSFIMSLEILAILWFTPVVAFLLLVPRLSPILLRVFQRLVLFQFRIPVFRMLMSMVTITSR
jgi:hypothetical protein